MSTREKILDTALALFNKDGTSTVSTNHIAEAAVISPGNLYYHFRNKEAIIRGLFERLYDLWDHDLQLPDDHAPQLEDLKRIIATNYQIIWQYRFAYRELAALLRQDAELRKGFLAIRKRGFDGFRELLKVFSIAGVIRLPNDPEIVTELQELIWLVSELWLTSLEINGRTVNEAEMQHGVKLMLRIIQPYLVS